MHLDRAVGERPTPEPRAGSFEVGVEAMLRVSSSSRDRTTFGAFAFVQVPLARFAAPPRRALAPLTLPDAASALAPLTLPEASAFAVPARSGPAGALATPTPADAARALLAAGPPGPPGALVLRPVAEPPRTRPSRAESAPDAGSPAPAPVPAPAPAPPPAGASVPLLTGEIARGAVSAACKVAGLDDAEARLDGLAARAKSSALLPELRLRATRAIDESESLSPTEYDPLRRTASGGTSTWLEARATFRLDRLVFADDELAVERLRISRAAERARLVARVLELLDAWQRARAAEADLTAEPDVRRRAILAAAASEASLDVLTGGWFSKAIAAQGAGAAGPAAAPAIDGAAAAGAAPAAAPEPAGGRTDGAARADLARERSLDAASHDRGGAAPAAGSSAPRGAAPAAGSSAPRGAAPDANERARDANERTRDANEGPRRGAAQDGGASDTSRTAAGVSHDAAHPSPTARGAPRKM